MIPYPLEATLPEDMSFRREPLAPGEWYHCYTRGIDGRKTFEDTSDYRRFTQALYLSNSLATIERGSFWRLTHEKIFELPRELPLVSVGAYALMPNHFHLLLKENEEGGISKFMHRLGTSYTKYYNQKYERIGNLFIKPFRSRHVGTDSYLQRIVAYIHCNPAELFEPGWKDGQVHNVEQLKIKLEKFPHSSLLDYRGTRRPESRLLDWESIRDLLDAKMPPLKVLVPETIAYYKDLA